jgi:4-hydroxy-2-oxoglutarate aldolase
MLLSGIFPPITTPFYPDGEVYYKKLESNVERYSRTPVAGIVVQGSTGEAILLSDQERRDVLKAALSAAAPNKVMIAGTGVESAHETLRLTEYAAQLGYDAALVRTPHYYKKQMLPANLLAFYRTVADRSALPIIIYNFPQATGYDLPAEIVIELASHPNIVAIKESSGNLDKVKAMVEGTRHVKRQVTVTETFDAVTPRMLKAAAAESEKQSRELVSVATLAGTADPWSVGRLRKSLKTLASKAFVLRRNRRGKIKDAAERSRLPGNGRCRAPARAVTGTRSSRRHSRFRQSRADGVLRNLRRAQRR